MSIAIVSPAECYFEGMRQVLDIVAREKRYLAFLQAPPVEETYAFYRNILAKDLCQVIAVQDNAVVGWCDILSMHGEARTHVGTLGMGVLPALRHCGIGKMLMEAAVAKAWEKGLHRIELTVRTDITEAQSSSTKNSASPWKALTGRRSLLTVSSSTCTQWRFFANIVPKPLRQPNALPATLAGSLWSAASGRKLRRT
ncbi:GNAT family N-acetyltransferase [Pelomicrobium sp.]|jgi:GNAT superfamily N-acetyltransferase|uniref:GNAT family N-acetyltransferase n=1 Tax=Pelomicrobium sp. TaxID=2815319 RepID=UPI002FDD0F9F